MESNRQSLTPLYVNGAFMGLVVPPGRFDAHAWYSSMTFWVGAWVAFATLAALAIMACRWPRVIL